MYWGNLDSFCDNQQCFGFDASNLMFSSLCLRPSLAGVIYRQLSSLVLSNNMTCALFCKSQRDRQSTRDRDKMNERLKPTDSRASRRLSCNHVGRAVQTDLNFWQIDWQSVSAQPNKHASQHLLYVRVFIWKPVTGNQSALIHLYFQQLEVFSERRQFFNPVSMKRTDYRKKVMS